MCRVSEGPFVVSGEKGREHMGQKKIDLIAEIALGAFLLFPVVLQTIPGYRRWWDESVP